ncbi:DUF1566 domain-containing protein [Massilia forsythiae]|uniref:DUF1566 domain-containing protein n=1 Tax=Massilia forsythiae TaxID=2728020 RepID=A0A7Z2ZU72_9BURK|nr:hypothetical protein [Massilia forsythiae]QJE02005.1 DUF1566 domain-containing protein [Massilia forsythiae]
MAVSCLAAACSTGEGPPLGDFPAIEKIATDQPFTLTAPGSRSPAAFTYTSSNAAVATIDGATVTIKGVGTSTITASQERIGSYGPTAKSTTLTVTLTPVACPAGQARVNGSCQAVPACVSPAKLDQARNQCIAPGSSGDTVTVLSTGLTWRGVTDADTWTNARDFFTGSVIDSVGGWRLPTQAELSDLYVSGAFAGHKWALGNTWTSTPGTTGQASSHVVVALDAASTGERIASTAQRLDTLGAYVSCVR